MKKSDPKLEIIFENEDFFVLNKAPSTHSVKSAKNSEFTVQDWVEQKFPALQDLPDSGLLHRLDYETSGCLMVAKNSQAYEKFRDEIRSEGAIRKIYWALSNRKPSALSFDFYFFSRYRGSKKVSVKKTGKPGERGQGKIRILKNTKDLFLFEVELLGPGKRHQIRAALAELDAPLVGDSLYGGKDWGKGIALHARELRIESANPVADVPISWKSDWGQILTS